MGFFSHWTVVCASEAIRLFLVDRGELYFIEQTLTAHFKSVEHPNPLYFTKIHYSGVQWEKWISSKASKF